MRAVTYVVRTKLRSLVVPGLVLAAVIGIVLGIVIALAAGAHRTETVPERVDAAAGGGFDYLITQQQSGQPPLTDRVASLPGVRSADSYSYLFAGVAPAGAGLARGIDATVFAGSEGAFGVRVVDGRAVDQAVDDEFVVTPSFIRATGAKVGDRFDLYAISKERAVEGFQPDALEFTLTATLVGVIEGATTVDDPAAYLLFPRRLIDRPEVGFALTMIQVRVANGVDEATLRSELTTLPGSEEISVGPGQLITADVQRAIRTQARGMWILAFVAGIAALVTLTQVVTRQMRVSAAEREALATIGFSNGQMFMETMTRAAVPIVAGGVLATGLAIVCSGMFPTGTVAGFEPSPGVLVQAGVLVSTAFVVVTLLLLLTGAVLGLSRTKNGEVVVASPVVNAVASRAPVLAAAIGIRLGFTRARGERGSLRAALAGVLFTVGGLIGAITFGASVDRLIDEPFRYGWNMDAGIGDEGGEEMDAELAATLESDPNVESLIYYAQEYAKANGADVPVMGMQRVRGVVSPVILAGRLPVSEDEIAMGRVTARQVGATVGDEVTVAGSMGEHTYRVVGLVVLEGLGSNDGIGQGALTTLDGLHQISDAAVTSASVDFDSRDAAIAKYPQLAASSSDVVAPPAITSLARVRSVPYVLAGLLGLLAVLTIAQTLLSSLRARRRDLAIVRALGGAPRLLRRSVHWQATVVTLVPALLGVPLGLIAGRLVFRALADDIGAIDSAKFPTPAVVAVIVGIVLLANVVAMWPAHMARRLSAAAALRTE